MPSRRSAGDVVAVHSFSPDDVKGPPNKAMSGLRCSYLADELRIPSAGSHRQFTADSTQSDPRISRRTQKNGLLCSFKNKARKHCAASLADIRYLKGEAALTSSPNHFHPENPETLSTLTRHFRPLRPARPRSR
jgi:hypothetical protein